MIEVEESLSFNGIERPKSKANYAISDETKKGISVHQLHKAYNSPLR